MLGPFFLKPPIDMFMVSNGNYGSCLEPRLRDLIFFAFLALFGGRRGQKWIFFNCSIYYHVIPQNVLLFFQKNNECVCFSKFSIFEQFYVHFWSKLTPFRLRNFSEIFFKTFFWLNSEGIWDWKFLSYVNFMIWCDIELVKEPFQGGECD